MLCPECGSEMGDSTFCIDCGYLAQVPATRRSRKPQKKKKTPAIVFIAAAALVLIVVLSIVLAFVLRSGGEHNAYITLSGGSYNLVQSLSEEKSAEIIRTGNDNEKHGYVEFSKDGKYVYFMTKLEGNIGTLNRAEVSKLKNGAAKNEKVIQVVGQNVNAMFASESRYPGKLAYNIQITPKGNAVYKCDNGEMYYYEGKEPVKLAKDVDSFWLDENGTRVIFLQEGRLMGVKLDKPADVMTLGKDIYEYGALVSIADFDRIVLKKDGEMMVTGFDKGCEKVKMNGQIVNRTVTSDDGKNVYALVATDVEKHIFSLCRLEQKTLKPLAEDIAVYGTYPGAVVFADVDRNEDGHPDWEGDISVLLLDSGKIASLSGSVTEEIGEAGGSPALVFTEDGLYMQTNAGELLYSKLGKNSFGKFELVADGVGSYSMKSGKLYIKRNADEKNYGELAVVENGKLTSLVRNVCFEHAIYVFEDGMIEAITDENDKGEWEYSMIDKQGNAARISDEMTDPGHRVDEGHLLYLANGNLYCFDGKKSVKIGSDVDRLWVVSNVNHTYLYLL